MKYYKLYSFYLEAKWWRITVVPEKWPIIANDNHPAGFGFKWLWFMMEFMET